MVRAPGWRVECRRFQPRRKGLRRFRVLSALARPGTAKFANPSARRRNRAVPRNDRPARAGSASARECKVAVRVRGPAGFHSRPRTPVQSRRGLQDFKLQECFLQEVPLIVGGTVPPL